jgi:hypothetical protein
MGARLTLEDTVEFFNLILETKLSAQEKEDLVAFLVHYSNSATRGCLPFADDLPCAGKAHKGVALAELAFFIAQRKRRTSPEIRRLLRGLALRKPKLYKSWQFEGGFCDGQE